MGKIKLKGLIKGGGGKVKNAVSFAALVPFKPVMVAMLKKRGEKVSMKTKTEDLAVMFYNKIIKKQSYQDVENLDPVTVSLIVSTIVSFIKNIKEKKQKGEELTEDEKRVDAAISTMNPADIKTPPGGGIESKNILGFSPGFLLLVGIGFFIAFK